LVLFFGNAALFFSSLALRSLSLFDDAASRLSLLFLRSKGASSTPPAPPSSCNTARGLLGPSRRRRPRIRATAAATRVYFRLSDRGKVGNVRDAHVAKNILLQLRKLQSFQKNSLAKSHVIVNNEKLYRVMRYEYKEQTVCHPF
jgi:hypothetical protein